MDGRRPPYLRNGERWIAGGVEGGEDELLTYLDAESQDMATGTRQRRGEEGGVRERRRRKRRS